MNSNQIDLFLAVLFCMAAIVYLLLGYWNDRKLSIVNPKLFLWHKYLKYVVFLGALVPLITTLGAVLVVLLFFEIS